MKSKQIEKKNEIEQKNCIENYFIEDVPCIEIGRVGCSVGNRNGIVTFDINEIDCQIKTFLF